MGSSATWFLSSFMVLEVPGLPEPMGLDHRDHRGLRAEGGQGEGGGGGGGGV